MDTQKNKEKIMLIVPMLHQGGFERICALTARLLNTEFDVYLVVFNTEDMFYDVSGIKLIDLNLGAAQGKLGKLIQVYKRVKRVRSLKKKLGIQVSYSFGQTANIVNALAKAGDKTWAGIRGYGALADNNVMKLICRFSDRVVSCTKVMEEEISRRFHVKSSATLYNPCNLAEIYRLAEEPVDEHIQQFIDKKGKLVVSMGREDDLKGFWHLIKSVYLLKKKMTDIKLAVIGDGDYIEYKELVNRLGMSENVLFTGVQKNPFSILARADAYALTSESEGFPNALIEAMAVGLPCVSVNCKTGPAEILSANYAGCSDEDCIYRTDYGILTPVFTGEKDLSAERFSREEGIFAEELERLLTDTESVHTYKMKSRKRAEDFGMETYVQSICELIEQDLA